MRNTLLTVIYSMLFLWVDQDGAAQQVFRTTDPSVIGYLEYLPADYHLNSNKYPVVFFLHGIGERGPNSTDTTILKASILNVAKHGPPKHVNAGTEFPFILISPQLKNNYGTWTTAYVMEVINHCKTYLRIDERRIYLTGLSLGGGGTWTAAQDNPELFAAIAPVCGGYNSPSKACEIAGENLPVWAFHGDKDTVVPLSKSQAMVNAINACIPTPGPLAKMTIYPGVGHNAWDYAFKTDNSLHTPNVYDWILSFTNTKNNGNNIPVANAGADKTIKGNKGTIYGSGTDSGGSIAGYQWTQMSGPAATLNTPTSAALSLTNLQLGTYMFRLRVTDNSGNSDQDFVKVTVQNAIPVANAGPDIEMTWPSNSAVIAGSGTDADGTITAWSWTKVSGGNAVLTNATTPQVSASHLVQGTYVFRLTVTDDRGAKHSNDMSLIVKAPVTPIVTAGADKLVKLPTTSATITGSATDGDGTIATYAWRKISGGACSMTSITTATLKLSGLASGVYIFELTATDNDGHAGNDQVVVTVDAPPVVNAGVDRTVTLPMLSSISLAGSATDADGTVTKYQWSKYAGPNVTVENSASPTLNITKLYEGTYVFKLAVTDDLGVQGYDYVTITVTSGL